MESAKIRLSEEEHALVKNADWILTKNAVLVKVNNLLASLQSLQSEMLHEFRDLIPDAAHLISPKISRGENYKGLPWLMLDYPRLFDKENVFAVRTMFWWGHYFSSTLHLRGRWKKCNESSLFDKLSEEGEIRINHLSEWDHDVSGAQYYDAKDVFAYADAWQLSAFVKLTIRRNFDSWDDVPALLAADYRKLLSLLKN